MIKSFIIITILECVFGSSTTKHFEAHNAGGLALYLDTNSTQSLLQTMLPIMSYFVFKDQTFKLGYDNHFLFNKVYFDQIKFDEFGGYQDKVFGFSPILDNAGNQVGEAKDELKLKINGLNIAADVKAGIKLLSLLPMTIQNFNVSDLGLEASVRLQKSKGSWSLVPNVEVSMDDFDLHMEEIWLNKLLDFCKPWYTKLV